MTTLKDLKDFIKKIENLPDNTPVVILNSCVAMGDRGNYLDFHKAVSGPAYANKQNSIVIYTKMP